LKASAPFIKFEISDLKFEKHGSYLQAGINPVFARKFRACSDIQKMDFSRA